MENVDKARERLGEWVEKRLARKESEAAKVLLAALDAFDKGVRELRKTGGGD